MNIVILTADEPLYLPRFFAEFLSLNPGKVQAIFITPSLYGRDSTVDMVRKYIGAFGLWNLARLVKRTLSVKLRNKLGLGRSRGCYYSIPAVAKAHGITCEAVSKVNDPEFLQRLRDMKTDLIESVSCPQVFRKSLIELPPAGCLNMHGAILPNYRGIAPSFWMMSKGEKRAGVTVFFVNEDIDAGEVVELDEYDIRPNETLDEFIIRSKSIAANVLCRAIRRISSGPVETTPLDKDAGSYFGYPTREAYQEFCRRGRRLW